jgi:serine protein kinase
VPYCVRINEEVEIYKKLLRGSELSKAPIAPGTLEMLASFSVVSRLSEPENSKIFSKLHVYNGEHRKDKDPKAKSIMEYRDEAEANEGFKGVSTRDAFKIISQVFNFDHEEIAANPVHLFMILEASIPELFISAETQDSAVAILNEHLKEDYADLISQDIQVAFLDSYHPYGQSLFDRYVLFADQWVQDKDYRDPETGQLLNKKVLEQELQKIEKPADISSPKEFRQEVVNFCIRYQSKHNGQNPDWESWEKVRDVIRQVMFGKTEEMIPLISFSGHGDEESQAKHKKFVERMKEKGYTEKQVRLLYEWQLRYSKAKES